MGNACKAQSVHIQENTIHNYQFNNSQNQPNNDNSNLKLQRESSLQQEDIKKSAERPSIIAISISSNDEYDEEEHESYDIVNPIIEKNISSKSKFSKRNSVVSDLKLQALQNAMKNKNEHSIAFGFMSEKDQLRNLEQQKKLIKLNLRNKNKKQILKTKTFFQKRSGEKRSLDKRSNSLKNSKQDNSNKSISSLGKTINNDAYYQISINSEQSKWSNEAELLKPKLNLISLTTRELADIVHFVFTSKGYYESYNINIQKFGSFLTDINYHYSKRNNPFHNFRNNQIRSWCDGDAWMFYLWGNNSCQRFCLTFSGLCHDVNHTARTNVFEVNFMSKIALRYSDKSCLEMYHLATTFKVLRNQNFIENLDINYFKEFRKNLISNILATDIKNHFQLMESFENNFLDFQNDEEGKKIKNSMRKNFDLPKLHSIQEKDQLILSNMLIHTADFHGNAQEFEVSNKWSQLVSIEFSDQYQEELDNGIPLTPYYKGLENIKVQAKAEIGFVAFIVQPLFKMSNCFLEGGIEWSEEMIQNNYNMWKKVESKLLQQVGNQKSKFQLHKNRQKYETLNNNIIKNSNINQIN